jgi:four helix bundle protein
MPGTVKYDLEERLIPFAVMVIKLAEKMPRSMAGNHLAAQLTRSGTFPTLQYGEAQSAESRADFIHKLKIALKELRETNCCLKIINHLQWFEDESSNPSLKECNELIAIIAKSIAIAQQNKLNTK